MVKFHVVDHFSVKKNYQMFQVLSYVLTRDFKIRRKNSDRVTYSVKSLFYSIQCFKKSILYNLYSRKSCIMLPNLNL